MPNHIRYFEWTWLVSILLGIIVAGLTYDELAAKSNPVSIWIIQLLVLVFAITLVLLISRQKNNFFRLTLLFIFPVGLYFYIPQLSILFSMKIVGVLSSVQLTLQCLGLYFLFTSQSRQWFQNTPSQSNDTSNTNTPTRTLFGKFVKWIFIGFNIIMLLSIIWLASNLDGIDISSIHKDDTETLSRLMITGTWMYFGFFLWIVGAVVLGVLVLCTRPK
jgi:hypothetical protein